MTVCYRCLKHYKTIWEGKSPDSPSQGVDCATKFYSDDRLVAGYGSSHDCDCYKSYDAELNAAGSEVVLCDTCVEELLELGKLKVTYDENYEEPTYPLRYYDRQHYKGCARISME